MAVRRRFTVEAVIQAKDQASAGLSKATSRFGELGKSLGGLPGIALGVTGALGTLAAAFIKGGRDALQYQQQVLRLENALRRTPGATAGFSNALKDQASVLATLSGQTDKSILSVQALLAQIGVAPAQLQQATQASIDLSSALGISLESAARNVGRTVGGFAGELGEMVPELKNLSTEALKAGEGISLLAGKFSGATVETQNLSTQTTTLVNELGNLARALAAPVAQSGTLAALLQGITNSVLNMTAAFEDVNKSVEPAVQAQRDWEDAIKDTNTSMESAVTALENLLRTQGASRTEIEAQVANFRTLRTLLGSTAAAVEVMSNSMDKAATSSALWKSSTEEAAGIFKELGITLEKVAGEQLEALIEKEKTLDILFRNSAITARDYEKAMDAIQKKREELLGVTNETVDALDREKDARDGARISLDQESKSLDLNSQALRRNSSLVSSSTRLRTTFSGGSRLTGSAGGFSNLSGGTFTTITNNSRPYVLPDGQVVWSAVPPTFVGGP